MSLSNQTNKIYGSGNGSTATFSFPFKIFDTSELYAYNISAAGVVTQLAYTTDFTATINSVTEGGTVTFVVPPASGSQWFLKRIVPFTQSAVIPSEGTFPGKQFENQLDLITMMVIQGNEAISRAVTFPATYTGSVPTLPTPQANLALAWDPTGTSLVNIAATGVGTIPVPITDSNLSQITSANKVSGTALTGLASISAGAGVIPAANVPGGQVPVGGIIMWSGTIASIPTNWALCNGSNGTPDLRNRFIVGADADVAGVAKSTVTGSAAQTGEGQLPATTLSTLTASKYFGATSPAFSIGGDGTNNLLTYTPSFGTGTANVARFYALAYIMRTA